MENVTISDTLIILATLLSPLIAVQVQKWIERAYERRQAQLSIFYSLMATRATRLAPEHVQALNRIDLEFGKTKWRRQSLRAKEVTNRWRIYADHLNDLADNHTQIQLEAWIKRGDDLFINLLAAIASALGYTFDEVQLRRGIYHPRGHTETEIRQEVIQRALADILIGKRSFPTEITGVPINEEAFELQKAALQSIVDAVKDGALNVKQRD